MSVGGSDLGCRQDATHSNVTTSFLSLTRERPTAISPISRSSSFCKHSGTLPPNGRPFGAIPNLDRHVLLVHVSRDLITSGISSHFSRSAVFAQRQILDWKIAPGNFCAHIDCKLFFRVLRWIWRASLHSLSCFLFMFTGRGSDKATLASSFSFFNLFQYLTTWSFFSMVVMVLVGFNSFSYTPRSLVLYSLGRLLRLLTFFFWTCAFWHGKAVFSSSWAELLTRHTRHAQMI